jgi:hypothetical protein
VSAPGWAEVGAHELERRVCSLFGGGFERHLDYARLLAFGVRDGDFAYDTSEQADRDLGAEA